MFVDVLKDYGTTSRVQGITLDEASDHVQDILKLINAHTGDSCNFSPIDNNSVYDKANVVTVKARQIWKVQECSLKTFPN